MLTVVCSLSARASAADAFHVEYCMDGVVQTDRKSLAAFRSVSKCVVDTPIDNGGDEYDGGADAFLPDRLYRGPRGGVGGVCCGGFGMRTGAGRICRVWRRFRDDEDIADPGTEGALSLLHLALLYMH